MKRELNLGNIIGIAGAGVAILGMFLPYMEFLHIEASWYQLVTKYGGMTGLGMGEIVILILIILLAGYLIFAGSCGTGLAIGFLSVLYFIVNYLMSTEEMESSGAQLGIGAGLIVAGEIAMIVGGFTGAMTVQGKAGENQSNDSQENLTSSLEVPQQSIENIHEKIKEQSSFDENTENTVCPYCGGILKENTKFCPLCGAKLTFCSGCNSILKEESKYCPYCGAEQEKR